MIFNRGSSFNLIASETSVNEPVINACEAMTAATVAKAKGMKVIGLTGEKDSKLSEISDTCIQVPETETYKIQELHLPVYHCLCLMLEDTFFGKE